MKSHVSLEQQVCVVCGKPFDTGAVLLDKRLKDSMESHTVTGWGMCPAHEEQRANGFVALVECDPTKTPVDNHTVKQEEAYRTGVIVHIRREVWSEIFDVPAPDDGVLFIDPDVTKVLVSLMPKEEG